MTTGGFSEPPLVLGGASVLGNLHGGWGTGSPEFEQRQVLSCCLASYYIIESMSQNHVLALALVNLVYIM